MAIGERFRTSTSGKFGVSDVHENERGFGIAAIIWRRGEILKFLSEASSLYVVAMKLIHVKCNFDVAAYRLLQNVRGFGK